MVLFFVLVTYCGSVGLTDSSYYSYSFEDVVLLSVVVFAYSPSSEVELEVVVLPLDLLDFGFLEGLALGIFS